MKFCHTQIVKGQAESWEPMRLGRKIALAAEVEGFIILMLWGFQQSNNWVAIECKSSQPLSLNLLLLDLWGYIFNTVQGKSLHSGKPVELVNALWRGQPERRVELEG